MRTPNLHNQPSRAPSAFTLTPNSTDPRTTRSGQPHYPPDFPHSQLQPWEVPYSKPKLQGSEAYVMVQIIFINHRIRVKLFQTETLGFLLAKVKYRVDWF